MTKEEIIEMAYQTKLPYDYVGGKLMWLDKLEHFAKLIAEKERKKCWNIVFDYAARDDLTPEDESLLKHIADLMRARGQE
jgi:hypothetical protein